MKVLITGVAGFIGSTLADCLLDEGFAVVGIDNFDEFYDPRLKRVNIRVALQRADFELVEGDFRDPRFLGRVFRDHTFQAVLHLGACVGVRPSIERVSLYVDVNLAGTTQLLEASRHGGVSRFLFASSSSVYGVRPAEPFSERDNVDHPISPYAATKKAGELLCYTYHHLFQMKITGLRFFTVYGPRQRPEMAIHKFTRAIDQGEPITIYGDGSARRDFTYISDIISGIRSALDRCDGYHVYNLGGGNTVTVNEVVRLIEKELGKKAIIEYRPTAPGDVPNTLADVFLAREKLDYYPQVEIADGIRKFVFWYLCQKNRKECNGYLLK